jgi:hypothetical protein
MHRPRANAYSARVVDEGLILARVAGRYHAAHFMHHHGMEIRVIVRVLAPGAHIRLRRVSDALLALVSDSLRNGNSLPQA